MLKRKVTALISGMIIAFMTIFSFASAQDGQSGGNGLQLQETRTEMAISPGETKNFSFIVKNITNGDLEAQVSVNDFESDGFTGNPQIIVDSNERTPTTINNFVKGLKDFPLKTGESKKVELQVVVPEDAAPGAYFGVVRYAAVPKGGVLSDADRQLALTASVAHLVLIEVAGEITEQIQVEDLYFQKDESRSSIFFKAPNKASLAIKNLGNGFSRPFGDISIKNMFGTEVTNYKVNDINPKGIILPKSSRTFTNDISGVKMPGRYTASAAVAYGNGGEVVPYYSSFWYLPAWFILALLLSIAIIGGGGYYFYKKKYAPTKSSKRKSKK